MSQDKTEPEETRGVLGLRTSNFTELDRIQRLRREFADDMFAGVDAMFGPRWWESKRRVIFWRWWALGGIGLVYASAVWLAAEHWTAMLWVILWPVAVGLFVYHRAALLTFQVDAVTRNRGGYVGIEFWLSFKSGLYEHPLVASSSERYREIWDDLADDEQERMEAMAFGSKDIRYLMHSGLIWSYEKKSYGPICMHARAFGDALGPDGTEPADSEPSILVQEDHGRIRVAIVPLISDAGSTYESPREASIAGASRLLAGESDYFLDQAEREGPRPAVVADIPLGALTMLECEATTREDYYRNDDAQHSRFKRWLRARNDVLAESGFAAVEPRYADAHWSREDPTEIENEFVRFSFRRVERPWWI
jgi:hypothetical protein